MFKTVDKEYLKPSVGIGVIGYAFMGHIHSNAYSKMRYTFPEVSLYPELIAAAGRNEEKVSAFAAEFGFKGYYTDWNELIADPDVEIVDNCSADPNHFAPTLEALKQGKHVICEKPLGLDLKECEALVEASQYSGSKHMTCFNYRFIPAARLARDLINAGRIGRIYHIRACYYQSPGYDPAASAEKVWYCRPERVGIMQGIGSHVIDLSRFLVGEIKSVGGLSRTFNTKRRMADGSTIRVKKDELNIATVEFESGAIGTLESSGISVGYRNRNEFEIFGTKGSLKFSLEDLNHLDVCIPEEQSADIAGYTRVSVTEPFHPLQCLYLPRGHNQGWEYGHVHALRHFLDCVANDTTVEPYGATLIDGYRVQKIMDCLFEASETEKRINIRYK